MCRNILADTVVRVVLFKLGERRLVHLAQNVFEIVGFLELRKEACAMVGAQGADERVAVLATDPTQESPMPPLQTSSNAFGESCQLIAGIRPD